MLDWKIKVSLDTDVTECQCCGKKNLKRTIHLILADGAEIYLGVICCSQWFDLNLTGNPWYSAAKLERYINNMEKEEVEEIINQIKEESELW